MAIRVEPERRRLRGRRGRGSPLAEAAHSWIRLALPEGMEAAIIGVEIKSRGNERDIVVPFAQNVVLGAGPIERRTMEGDGLRGNGFFLKVDEESFEQGMQDAPDALERLGEAFGPYAFPELDRVEVPLSGGAAIRIKLSLLSAPGPIGAGRWPVHSDACSADK